MVFLYIDYCKIQLNARNYAWNRRKDDTAQHSCVRHLGNALDERDWHLTSAFSQRLQKYTFMAVHTKTQKRRFQIYPLWRPFSNLCVYGERFHRLRVDGRPKRIKKSLRLQSSSCWRGHRGEEGGKIIVLESKLRQARCLPARAMDWINTRPVFNALWVDWHWNKNYPDWFSLQIALWTHMIRIEIWPV